MEFTTTLLPVISNNALPTYYSRYHLTAGKSPFPFLWATTVTRVHLQVILFTALDTQSISLLQYEHSSLAQVWRLITFVFVESDPRNLILNLPAQVLLGFLLENTHSSWKVVVLYFGGGIMAALSSSFLDKANPLLGGSPGVFAFGFSCLAETHVVLDMTDQINIML